MKFDTYSRYIKRGIDSRGDVANFVETEQILRFSALSEKTQGGTFSFVQVRGSIPLFWEQNEMWKLRPQIVPESNISASLTPLLNHVSALYKDYVLPHIPHEGGKRVEKKEADIVFVNLIDKSGTQGELGKFFMSGLQKISETREITPQDLNRTEISQDDYSNF
jgi:phosphatidylinositol 4-phosphatase